MLDLYCGKAGRMYQGIWHEAESYFGTDKNNPHNLALTARVSAEQASQFFDLMAFNVFDIDCYSSPWRVARWILRRRGAGRFGIVATVGEYKSLYLGTASEMIKAAIGARGLSDYRLMERYYDLIIKLMIKSLGDIPGVSLSSGVVARYLTPMNIMSYFALIIDKS